jgi:hypothetical protein
METIKGGATKRINRSRGKMGRLLEARFFDRAPRTFQEYNEKVQYIHLSLARARLARRPEDWPRSSVHDYHGSLNRVPTTPSALSVDRVLLPAGAHTRI